MVVEDSSHSADLNADADDCHALQRPDVAATCSASVVAETSMTEKKNKSRLDVFWERIGTTEFAFHMLMRSLEGEHASTSSSSDDSDDDERVDDGDSRLLSANAVDVLENPSSEQVERYVKARRPVLIRGWAQQWPAYEKWDLEYFQTAPVSDVAVDVDYGADGGGWRKMKLGQYIQVIRDRDWSSSPPYLRLWRYQRDAPFLSKDFSVAACFRDVVPEAKRPPPPHWIFISPAGASTPLHLDPWHFHAWFAQLCGRKRFLLFHPRDIARIANGREFVNPHDPDLSSFPGFADAEPLDVTVHPGEILYMPANWAHDVHALDDTVSLTQNFVDARCWKAIRALYLRFTLGKIARAAEGTTEEEEEEEESNAINDDGG
ncbi:JmjC domain-containing protein [Pseudoscourfieldia marina]